MDLSWSAYSTVAGALLTVFGPVSPMVSTVMARMADLAVKESDQLDAATSLTDLRDPPGNRLEKLKGNRDGQYSIRVNDQWRICFEWEDGAIQVEIVDYH